MGKGLVKTTFESGPDDSLAAVDVYEGGGSEIVNSYQKKSGGAIDVLSRVNGGGSGGGTSGGGSSGGGSSSGGSAGGSATSTGGASGGGAALTKNQINRILSNGNNAIFGYLTDLSSEVSKKFGTDKDTKNKVGTVVKGVPKPLNTDYSASDVKNIAGIANALSDGKYDNKVTDKKALDSLVSATVVTGAEAGLPEIFSTIAGNPDHDVDVLANSAKEAIELTISKGSVDVLFDVAKTKYIDQMNTRYPELIQDLFVSLAKPDELTEQDFNSFYFDLTSNLDKVRPNWNTTYRDNKPIQFTDISIANEFLDELAKSYSIFAPLNIKLNLDSEYNSAVDVEFASPEVGAYFRAIHGATNTLDTVYVKEVLDKWLEPEAMSLRDKQREAWYVSVASEFPKRSLVDDLKIHFPLEIPRIDSSISLR